MWLFVSILLSSQPLVSFCKTRTYQLFRFCVKKNFEKIYRYWIHVNLIAFSFISWIKGPFGEKEIFLEFFIHYESQTESLFAKVNHGLVTKMSSRLVSFFYSSLMCVSSRVLALKLVWKLPCFHFSTSPFYGCQFGRKKKERKAIWH